MRYLFGAMLIVGLAVSAYVFLIAPGSELTARNLGVVVGGALGLLALPLLIAGSWELVQRRSGNYTATPLVVAGTIFALLAVFAIIGAKQEYVDASMVSSSTYIFMPAGGCTYSVEFPEKAEIRENHFDGNIVSKEASLYLKDVFMRAECVVIGGNFPVTEAAIRTYLMQYADKQGLTDVTASSETSDGHVVVRGRGVKMVSGTWATYDIRIMVGPQSMMTAVGAGVSSGFPQPGISQFLNSIRPISQ